MILDNMKEEVEKIYNGRYKFVHNSGVNYGNVFYHNLSVRLPEYAVLETLITFKLENEVLIITVDFATNALDSSYKSIAVLKLDEIDELNRIYKNYLIQLVHYYKSSRPSEAQTIAFKKSYLTTVNDLVKTLKNEIEPSNSKTTVANSFQFVNAINLIAGLVIVEDMRIAACSTTKFETESLMNKIHELHQFLKEKTATFELLCFKTERIEAILNSNNPQDFSKLNLSKYPESAPFVFSYLHFEIRINLNVFTDMVTITVWNKADELKEYHQEVQLSEFYTMYSDYLIRIYEENRLEYSIEQKYVSEKLCVNALARIFRKGYHADTLRSSINEVFQNKFLNSEKFFGYYYSKYLTNNGYYKQMNKSEIGLYYDGDDDEFIINCEHYENKYIFFIRNNKRRIFQFFDLDKKHDFLSQEELVEYAKRKIMELYPDATEDKFMTKIRK